MPFAHKLMQNYKLNTSYDEWDSNVSSHEFNGKEKQFLSFDIVEIEKVGYVGNFRMQLKCVVCEPTRIETILHLNYNAYNIYEYMSYCNGYYFQDNIRFKYQLQWYGTTLSDFDIYGKIKIHNLKLASLNDTDSFIEKLKNDLKIHSDKHDEIFYS
jgi:hypothetical protein